MSLSAAGEGAADGIADESDDNGGNDDHQDAEQVDLVAAAVLMAVEHGNGGKGRGQQVGAGAAHGGHQGDTHRADGPATAHGQSHAHAGHHRDGGHIGGKVGHDDGYGGDEEDYHDGGHALGQGGDVLLDGRHDTGRLGAHGAAQIDADADEEQDTPVDALVDHGLHVQQGLAVDLDHRHHHYGENGPEGDAQAVKGSDPGRVADHGQDAGQDPHNDGDKEDDGGGALPQAHGALLLEHVLHLKILKFGHIGMREQPHHNAQQHKQDQAGGYAEGQIAEQAQGVAGGSFIDADAQNGQGVGDGGHGPADVDAEHREDIGHMGVGVLACVAKFLVDAGDKGQHEGGGGHLIHEAAQQHTQHAQRDGKDPGAFTDQFHTHELGHQPVGEARLVEGVGHDETHEHKIDDPVADGAGNGLIDGAYAALAQQHHGQHGGPHRVHQGEQ